MSDTFWTLFFGVIILYVKDWIDGRRQARTRAAVESVKDVTITGHGILYNKVESATKEVNEQANAAARIATKAVTQNVMVSDKLIESTKDLAAKTEVINDRLNGGPGGLHELSIRVAKVEGQVDILVKSQDVLTKGQVDMVKSMDHFAEVLERKLS